MNKAKHRLLTPVELAEQKKALMQAATAKMAKAIAEKKAKVEAAKNETSNA
jgi:hypothetical protein